MMSNQTKTLCLMAVALIVSGCSGGGGDEVTVPLIVDDGAIVTDGTTIADDTIAMDDTTISEVVDSTDTSDGIATPVQPVGSVQMDAFVTNPLLAAIPAELTRSASVATSNNYVTNPLMQ